MEWFERLVIHSIRWRSITPDEEGIDQQVFKEAIGSGIAAQEVEAAQSKDVSSEYRCLGSMTLARSPTPDPEGDLKQVGKLSSLDFEAEVSAEDYSTGSHGRQARGIFQKVDTIRWDHDESDWSIEDLDFEAPFRPAEAAPAKPCVEGNPSMANSHDRSPPQEVALQRLREFALRRRWLASAAAIEKLSQNRGPLSNREWAAIEHMMSKAEATTRYAVDSRMLRGLLVTQQSGADNGEIAYPIGMTATDTEAVVKNRETPGRRPNADGGPFTQADLCSSVLRVRKIAAERNWLSPKSSMALAKLGERNVPLIRPEMNALTYLLERFASIPELRADLEIVREAATK